MTRGNSVRKFWNLYETKGETAALSYLKKSPRGFFLKLVETMQHYRNFGPDAVRNGQHRKLAQIARDALEILARMHRCR